MQIIMSRQFVLFVVFIFNFAKVYSQEENITVSEVVKNFTAAENELYPSSLFNVKDVTINDLTSDLDTWESPQWMQINYPYYHAGYDYDNRPVWVVEMGKYQMRKLVEKGPEALKNFTKYCVQAAKIIIKSHKDKNPEGNQASFILDFDGLRFEQFAHIPTTAYIIKLAREFRQIIFDYTEVAIVVNVNYVTETLMNLIRPIWPDLFNIAEIYGTNKAVWIPRLLKHFPRESLPEWYGGNRKDYKPVQVRG